MSGRALVWAANVRGLKPATKIVLIQLAERHNKDTGLCNPSIKTLAEDCEMDRTTVMRHLELLERFGLLTKKARGGEGAGRQENEYALHLPKDVVTTVEDGAKSQNTTGAKSQNTTGAKSQSDGGLSRNPTGAKSHSCATLTLREPVREPSLFGSDEPSRDQRESETPDRAEEFWDAYPRCKRKIDKADTIELFRKIVAGKHRKIPKADPHAIIAAVRRFAASGDDPDYMPLPTTWLNRRRWEAYPEPEAPPPRRVLGPGWGEVVR